MKLRIALALCLFALPAYAGGNPNPGVPGQPKAGAAPAAVSASLSPQEWQVIITALAKSDPMDVYGGMGLAARVARQVNANAAAAPKKTAAAKK